MGGLTSRCLVHSDVMFIMSIWRIVFWLQKTGHFTSSSESESEEIVLIVGHGGHGDGDCWSSGFG